MRSEKARISSLHAHRGSRRPAKAPLLRRQNADRRQFYLLICAFALAEYSTEVHYGASIFRAGRRRRSPGHEAPRRAAKHRKRVVGRSHSFHRIVDAPLDMNPDTVQGRCPSILQHTSLCYTVRIETPSE